MFWKLLVASFVASSIHFCTAHAAITCPSAPQGVAREIVTDTQGSVNGLKALVGGELRNRTEITAKNLFEKYPNADRITVATLMMSVYCQQIGQSTQLTDKEKLDQLNIVNDRLITLMTSR